MRRMMITVGVTVAGTAAVLLFEPSLERAARTAAGLDDADGTSLLAGDSVSLAHTDRTAAPAQPLTWMDGPAVETSAGTVQVQVGLADGRIEDARAGARQGMERLLRHVLDQRSGRVVDAAGAALRAGQVRSLVNHRRCTISLPGSGSRAAR